MKTGQFMFFSSLLEDTNMRTCSSILPNYIWIFLIYVYELQSVMGGEVWTCSTEELCGYIQDAESTWALL